MRPGCKPKVDEYFVEEIVGRRLADSGDAYEWLVKWDGSVRFLSSCAVRLMWLTDGQ